MGRVGAALSFVCLVLLVASAIPAHGADPGQPINGLKLTLTADKTDLQMSALQLRRATPDTPSYGCESTKLNLTFQNVSDKPIKLDVYDLTWVHLKLSVTGPNDKSVTVIELEADRQLVPPKATDYPVMEPGKSHSVEVTFPGQMGSRRYVLMRPGRYVATVSYVNPNPPGDIKPLPLAVGAWMGTVTSNAVAFNALPPANEPLMGEPANGLAFGLSLPKYTYTIGEQVKPTVVLRNVSDKPVLTLPLLVARQTVFFKVVRPDGNEIRYRGPEADWDVPDYDTAVKDLPAGEGVTQPLGLGGFDLSKPGRYVVSAEYRWPNAKPPPGRRPAVWTRGPIWTGKIASGELTFLVSEPGAAGDGKQGLQGQVVKLSGNFMPGPGPRPGGTRTPLAVLVHVFRGKVKPFGAPDRKHAQLVTVVQADKDGRLKVALPPGEYAAVAEIDGKLYLNLYDGDGHWGTVQVQPGRWTTFDIEDTTDAAF